MGSESSLLKVETRILRFKPLSFSLSFSFSYLLFSRLFHHVEILVLGMRQRYAADPRGDVSLPRPRRHLEVGGCHGPR